MRITCRFRHSRAARLASRALVVALIWTGLLPVVSRGVVYASDITPPEPAPVRQPIVGFADTHVHQFSNLAFGGLEVWGSPVDPTFDASQFLADPNAARGRALPDSDYTYLDTLHAIDVLGLGEVPAIGTPVAQMCDNGQCWPECPPGTGVQNNACWRIEVHGQGGGADLLNKLITHTPDHGTMGYPDMVGWPAYNVVTAQQVYWEWLKRAHDHGLKLMSMLAVNNQVLCHVAVHRASFGCDDDSSVVRQIEGAKKLETYIDSVEGGPGMGFYRVVYSAAEARAAIDAGKLAVVLGVEVDTPWRCRLNGFCTDADVTQEVQRYYDNGIRVVYPVHLIDNQFGGTALYDGIFEFANVLVNGGQFYRITTQCTPGLEWRGCQHRCPRRDRAGPFSGPGPAHRRLDGGSLDRRRGTAGRLTVPAPARARALRDEPEHGATPCRVDCGWRLSPARRRRGGDDLPGDLHHGGARPRRHGAGPQLQQPRADAAG
jgi:hypothetical protein